MSVRLKFAAIVWAITLFLGFNISYFLIFHVRSAVVRTVLFLLCAIPFWTSGIIRTIAWIPFLGRNGAFNQLLMGLGLTSHPLEFLLFSDFAVIITYVHLFTLLMVGPIANSLSKIDPALLEAARGCRGKPVADDGRYRDSAVEDRDHAGVDPGVHAGDGRLLRCPANERRAERVHRIDAVDGDPGDAISAGFGQCDGAGGVRCDPGGGHDEDRGCAQGTGEITWHMVGSAISGRGHSMPWRLVRRAFLLFLYGPMFVIYVLSFQGPNGGVTFPMVGTSFVWFREVFEKGQMADIPVSFQRSIGLAAVVSGLTVVDFGRGGAWGFGGGFRDRGCCFTSQSPVW